jgi:hypothetical protein
LARLGAKSKLLASISRLRQYPKRYRQVVEKEIHIGKSLKDEVRKLYQ